MLKSGSKQEYTAGYLAISLKTKKLKKYTCKILIITRTVASYCTVWLWIEHFGQLTCIYL